MKSGDRIGQAAKADHHDETPQWMTSFMLVAGMVMFGSATPVSKLVGQAFPLLFAGLLRVALGAAVLALLSWPVRSR